MSNHKIKSLNEWLEREKERNEIVIRHSQERSRKYYEEQECRYLQKLCDTYVPAFYQDIRDMDNNYFSGLPERVESSLVEQINNYDEAFYEGRITVILMRQIVTAYRDVQVCWDLRLPDGGKRKDYQKRLATFVKNKKELCILEGKPFNGIRLRFSPRDRLYLLYWHFQENFPDIAEYLIEDFRPIVLGDYYPRSQVAQREDKEIKRLLECAKDSLEQHVKNLVHNN